MIDPRYVPGPAYTGEVAGDMGTTPSGSAIGVLILAGGEATRLPGKLELNAGAVPLIVRVYRNVSAGRETFISCKSTFPPEIDRHLLCPMIVDRWTRRGPLAGMLTSMDVMTSRYVFAVAGDAPLVTTQFIDALAAQLRAGDEAVVPRHGDQIEPLAALYERRAFLRAGVPVLMSGRGALRLVIDRMQANYVSFGEDSPIFANVNTPAQYAAVQEVLS